MDETFQDTAAVSCNSVPFRIPVFSFLFQGSYQAAIETLRSKRDLHDSVPGQCEDSIQFSVHDNLDLTSYFLFFRLNPTPVSIRLLASLLQRHSFSISAFLLRCSEEFALPDADAAAAIVTARI